MRSVGEFLASVIGDKVKPKKQRQRGFHSFLILSPCDDRGHIRGHWVNPSKTYPYSSERQNERNRKRYGPE
jgi:hypothetical protein